MGSLETEGVTNSKRMEKRQKKHFIDSEVFRTPVLKLCITQTTTEMHKGGQPVNKSLNVSEYSIAKTSQQT